MPREQSVTATVDIQAPPERVWVILCDVTRYPEWVENTLKVLRSDGPARLGATYEERTRVAGPWTTSTKWHVTEFEPLRRQVHEGEGVVTAQGLAVILELAPAGANSRLSVTLRYTPRFGTVGAVIDNAIKGSVTRAQQRSADAFGALVDREYPSP